jgi:hypothetical protein
MNSKYVYTNERSEISRAIHILAYICITAMIVLFLYNTRKLFAVTGFIVGFLAVALFVIDGILCRDVYIRRKWHRYVKENGEEALGTVSEIIPVTITDEYGKTLAGNAFRVSYKSPITWEEKELTTSMIAFPLQEGAEYSCKVHEVDGMPVFFKAKEWFGNCVADSFAIKKEEK